MLSVLAGAVAQMVVFPTVLPALEVGGGNAKLCPVIVAENVSVFHSAPHADFLSSGIYWQGLVTSCDRRFEIGAKYRACGTWINRFDGEVLGGVPFMDFYVQPPPQSVGGCLPTVDNCNSGINPISDNVDLVILNRHVGPQLALGGSLSDFNGFVGGPSSASGGYGSIGREKHGEGQRKDFKFGDLVEVLRGLRHSPLLAQVAIPYGLGVAAQGFVISGGLLTLTKRVRLGFSLFLLGVTLWAFVLYVLF